MCYPLTVEPSERAEEKDIPQGYPRPENSGGIILFLWKLAAQDGGINVFWGLTMMEILIKAVTLYVGIQIALTVVGSILSATLIWYAAKGMFKKG